MSTQNTEALFETVRQLIQARRDERAYADKLKELYSRNGRALEAERSARDALEDANLEYLQAKKAQKCLWARSAHYQAIYFEAQESRQRLSETVDRHDISGLPDNEILTAALAYGHAARTLVAADKPPCINEHCVVEKLLREKTQKRDAAQAAYDKAAREAAEIGAQVDQGNKYHGLLCQAKKSLEDELRKISYLLCGDESGLGELRRRLHF